MLPRICHVIFSLEIGGAESFVAALARRQPGACVVVTDRPGELAPVCLSHGIPVTQIDRHAPHSGKALARYFTEQNIQVVHSHTQIYHRAARAAHRAGVPVHVWTDHGRPVPDPFKLRVLDWLHVPWVDMVVAVSEELARYLRTRVHIPRRKLRTIVNGVDTERFAPCHDDSVRQTVRRAWGMGAGTFVVGSVGRLVALKEYATLIRATAGASRQGCDIQLVIAGDGEERATLVRLAESLSAPVRFLGATDDIPSFLKAIDLFALASRSEGTSMAILEAQATGLPVFATPVGGSPHLVREGDSGRLLGVGAVEDWAQSFSDAAAARPLLTRWGKTARDRVQAEFSLERAALEYASLYEQLIQAGGNART